MRLHRWLTGAAVLAASLGITAPAMAQSSAPVLASHSASAIRHHPSTVSTDQARRNPVNSLLQSTYTGNFSGGNGGGYFVDTGSFDRLDMADVGTVSSASCYPFTCGNGLNNTYDGDTRYVFYYHGSSTCVNMSGNYTVSSTTCGGTHPYSEWVKTQHAVDGISGDSSWVNVGSSNAYSQGAYLLDNTRGGTDGVAGYGYSGESFVWSN